MTNNSLFFTMNAHTHCPQCYEFYLRDIDTRVLVEESEEGVVIRASRDTFSERRKLSFIRELAAEGFIADCFERSCQGVRWLVDTSAAMPHEDVTARTDRFMVCLWICALLLWAALLAGTIVHGRHHQSSRRAGASEDLVAVVDARSP